MTRRTRRETGSNDIDTRGLIRAGSGSEYFFPRWILSAQDSHSGCSVKRAFEEDQFSV